MMIPDIKKKKLFMVLPSTGKKVGYYPMGGGVEKELAKLRIQYANKIESIAESKNEEEAKKDLVVEMKDMTIDIISTLSQCFPDLDMNTITAGDLEAIQIELKRRCIDNILPLNVSCPICNNSNKVTVNLDNLSIKDVPKTLDVELGDGSILVVKHIPIMNTLEQLDKLDDTDIEIDNLVHSFVSVSITGTVIDMSKVSFEDKVSWAFGRNNLSIDDKYKIATFLDDEPGLEPITIAVNSCTGNTLDGKPFDMEFDGSILRQVENAKKEKGEEFESKFLSVKKCGHSFEDKIYRLSEFMSFV